MSTDFWGMICDMIQIPIPRNLLQKKELSKGATK